MYTFGIISIQNFIPNVNINKAWKGIECYFYISQRTNKSENILTSPAYELIKYSFSVELLFLSIVAFTVIHHKF